MRILLEINVESIGKHFKSPWNLGDCSTVVLQNKLCVSWMILHSYWGHSKLHLTNKLPTGLQIITWEDDHYRVTKSMSLEGMTKLLWRNSRASFSAIDKMMIRDQKLV